MSGPELTEIDWSGPAIDIIDDLVEIWFDRHPDRSGDDTAHDEANEWADAMFALHAI